MATVIRLKRGGRKGKPYYRIVVQDSRARIQGRDLDVLGFYHPTASPQAVTEVDTHKSLDWLGKGAQLSGTVRSIMSKTGVMQHFHEGTRPEPEFSIVNIKGDVVEKKGYTPPPPPREEPVKEEVAESAAEENPEEASAEETAADDAPAEAVAESDSEQAETDQA
ncbi:MAG: 30S ribosomal protein S16 [Candidatus Hydrogenedentales bacterium]|jgi:small subunit ribosomal protein S16